jgi:hypothetical protein
VYEAVFLVSATSSVFYNFFNLTEIAAFQPISRLANAGRAFRRD